MVIDSGEGEVLNVIALIVLMCQNDRWPSDFSIIVKRILPVTGAGTLVFEE